MRDPVLVLFVGTEASSGDSLDVSLDQASDRIEVRAESRSKAGLDRLEEMEETADCIVSRYDLPDVTGVEFLDAVRERYPDLPFILITNQGSESVASDAISAGVTEYVQEDRVADPCDALAERIEDSVETYQSKREARQSKRRLKELTESTADCLWIFTDDWEQLLYISGYEEVWGRSTEAIRANPRDFLDGVHPDDREHVRSIMERLSAGEAIDTEYRIRTGDGETGWVWVKGEPVFDEEGTVSRVVGFTRDITSRKERERRYETLVENLPGIVYRAEVDPDWPLIFAHGECEQLTGYTGTELTEQIDFGTDLIHPEDRAEVYETIQQAIKNSGSFELTYRIERKDGEQRWVWERGRQVGTDIVEGFITDITARVTHKQELEVRNQAIDESPVGITISDPTVDDNPIIDANQKFTEMTGYEEAEILGRNCRFLQGPDTRSEPVAEMRDAIDRERPVAVELRNYRKDGTMFWNRVSIAPVYDGDELVNYVGFQEDVTERKQREQQLKVLSRVLRHNLRNTQNVILSRAELLRAGADPAMADHADQIIETSEQLLYLAEKERKITEVLVEEPRQMSIELSRTIDGITERVSTEYPNASISVKCPQAVRVSTTPRIEQAVEELLTNAIIHSDESAPEVALTVTEDESGVHVTVADSGPTIPEIERNTLTDTREDTPVHHESGLGLWLVNLIVSRSGGTVTYEKNEPRGNRIRLDFPS